MQVSVYSDKNSEEWDEIVAQAPMATFIHTRRFLAYHRDRFQDLSVILRDDKHEVGVFPAAVDLLDKQCVVSHPGITFGGVLHCGSLAGDNMIEAIESLKSHYSAQGMKTMRYKAIPYIYQRQPASDDLYALFRLHAVRCRCDLSCAIDLANRREPSSRRKRSLKKALKAGVEVIDGAPFIGELWSLIEDNLERKLGEKPVHTAQEIKYLHELFPDNIKFLVGRLEGHIVAGVTLFSSGLVTRTQYIASGSIGNAVSALDAVLEHAIQQSCLGGGRYFDFGTSNRDNGQHLSESLYQFKMEFGGGGVAHEFYDIDLTA
jgi:hypothetical protein